MAKYSIRDLEQLSGIKAHTLRIWEKRHGLLRPQRTQSNIRTYDDEELKKIISVSILNEQGIKISRIASMSSTEIEDQVRSTSGDSRSYKYYVDQMIVAMVDLDELSFVETIQEVTTKIGFEDLVINVLYPFLDQIGVLWLTGNIFPAQEHFISNLIRQKIIAAIDSLPVHMSRKSPSIIMFLPEREMHEIGLLFHYFLAKKMGFKVIYLGQAVPARDIIDTLDRLKPAFLLSNISTYQFKDGGLEFLEKCSERPFCKNIFLSGPGLNREKMNLEKVIFFETARDIKKLLEEAIENV